MSVPPQLPSWAPFFQGFYNPCSVQGLHPLAEVNLIPHYPRRFHEAFEPVSAPMSVLSPLSQTNLSADFLDDALGLSPLKMLLGVDQKAGRLTGVLRLSSSISLAMRSA